MELEIKKILVKMNILDYIEYTPSSKQLIITRNPLGFISNFNNEEIYSGVKLNQDGQINDNSFIKPKFILSEPKSTSVKNFKVKKYIPKGE